MFHDCDLYFPFEIPKDRDKSNGSLEDADGVAGREASFMAELGRLRKNDTTEIVVQKTEYRGSVGIDIREYVTSDRYTGWSKNGIRIPVEMWQNFKEILERVDAAKKE